MPGRDWRRRAGWPWWVVLLGMGALSGCGRGPRAMGTLEQDAYVWQREWGSPVVEAVTNHAGVFARVVVLGAEVGWAKGVAAPRVVRVAYRPDMLPRQPGGVGLALRVGAFSGPFRVGEESLGLVTSTAEGLLDTARREGWTPAELQLDFDCAESALEGYRVWLEHLRARVAPVPLTFTALPSWLDRGAFGPLARAADGYVLQVHSLARPTSVAEPFTLCDPVRARKAVERAGRLAVPFRVALPSYGYLLAFGADGAFLGASAEGPPPARAVGTRFRELSADPVAMAQLVADWTRDRPAAMTGLIWYRLPVGGDRWNWRWQTLESVMAGRAPMARMRAQARQPTPGLHEVLLRNEGTADYSGPVSLRVSWPGGRAVGSDGIRGFSAETVSVDTLLFTKPICRLPAGESAIIGWVRLETGRDEVDLRLEFDSPPPASP